jgi:type II secretory pathway pseudopilin PulG
MSAERRDRWEDGFTLVEMLVAMVCVMFLVTATITIITQSSKAVELSSDQSNINEEARAALNRMARDTRQATSVVAAVNPDGPAFSTTSIVGVRLKADFDGDGCINGVALPGTTTTCNAYNSANPEDFSYCFDPSSYQLYVIDNGAAGVTPLTGTSTSCSGGQPLLAGNVYGFKVEYRSNDYRWDLDPTDGVTTWRELDEAGPPAGDGDGKLTAPELASIDSVVFDITMRLNGHSQDYRTQVSMRNQS